MKKKEQRVTGTTKGGKRKVLLLNLESDEGGNDRRGWRGSCDNNEWLPSAVIVNGYLPGGTGKQRGWGRGWSDGSSFSRSTSLSPCIRSAALAYTLESGLFCGYRIGRRVRGRYGGTLMMKALLCTDMQ